MSVDLDWEKITGGATGESLAISIRDFIDDRFRSMEEQAQLPRFIKSVKVLDFDLGTISPEVVIMDITDPLPDFYEDNEEADHLDAEDEDGAQEQQQKVEDSIVEGEQVLRMRTGWETKKRRKRVDEEQPTTHSNYAQGHNIGHERGRGAQSSSQAQREGDTGTRRRAAGGGANRKEGKSNSDRRQAQPPPVALAQTSPTPGVPGGTSNLHYFSLHPHHHWSGVQTPLAAVTGHHTHPGFGTTVAPGARPPPPMSIPRLRSLGQNHGGSGPASHSSVASGDVVRGLHKRGSVSTFAPAPSSTGGKDVMRNPVLVGITTSNATTLAPGGTALAVSSGSSSGGGGDRTPVSGEDDDNRCGTYSDDENDDYDVHDRDYFDDDVDAQEDEDEAVVGRGTGDDYEDNDDNRSTTTTTTNRAEEEDDTQVVFRIRYAGDVRLALTAELLLDYPMPAFVGIPLRLNITGLSFDGVGLVAKIRRRAHFCFLSPEDAQAYADQGGVQQHDTKEEEEEDDEDWNGYNDGQHQDDYDRSRSVNDKDPRKLMVGGGGGGYTGAGGSNEGLQGQQGKAITTKQSQRKQQRQQRQQKQQHKQQQQEDSGPIGGLLKEVKVESEIGESSGGDTGRQTLRNVGKVERFVLEKVRSIFEDELVYPSFWTFLI